jgi:hypothetical protein
LRRLTQIEALNIRTVCGRAAREVDSQNGIR